MLRFVVRAVVTLFVLLPRIAAAEPITLKLSFFSSNLSMSYLAAVKPFVDAVNAEAKGILEIKVYFSGALGKDIAQQPQLVLDGAFDIRQSRHRLGDIETANDGQREIPSG